MAGSAPRRGEALARIEDWALDCGLDFRHDPAGGLGAVFSPCGAYRYLLWRLPSPRAAVLGMGMLNPSTADERADDPTITRCRRIAAQAGHSNLLVWNLFAYRATAPTDLKRADEPIGQHNDAAAVLALELCSRTVLAWGNHGSHLGRDQFVRGQCGTSGAPVATLGMTKQGQPRHPLYLAATVRPRRWRPALLPSPAAQCHAGR